MAVVVCVSVCMRVYACVCVLSIKTPNHQFLLPVSMKGSLSMFYNKEKN